MGPADLESDIQTTKNNKGCGRDLLPNEVLNVGGSSLAIAVRGLAENIVADEGQLSSRGVRLTELSRNKGSLLVQ